MAEIEKVENHLAKSDTYRYAEKYAGSIPGAEEGQQYLLSLLRKTSPQFVSRRSRFLILSNVVNL